MKSDSALMNEVAHRTTFLHELTEQESQSLKEALLEIYKDVDTLCKRHGLTMMLGGGSCLGAVRHKGFIPWDDDLDIMMPRVDYEILIGAIEQGELGQTYEFTYPQKKKDSKGPFLKIYKKGTLNVELIGSGGDFPKGIFLDVFPMDYAPRSILARKIKAVIANGLQYMGILTTYAQFSTKELDDFMALDKELNQRYKTKKRIGKFLSIVPHRKWVYWFDCFVACGKDTGFLGIPTGRKYYLGEILESKVFLPTSQVEFEGLMVNIPGDYDKYLSNLYRNYMQLPPEDKRERHFIREFSL